MKTTRILFEKHLIQILILERSLMRIVSMAFVVVATLVSGNLSADIFVSPIAATSTSPNDFNTPSVLISDAASENYVAPNPASGGSGTSWWTNTPGSTTIEVSFDFGAAQAIDELVLWDYYDHSPTEWTLQLFSGAGGTGSELLNFDFSIAPGAVLTSTRHLIEFGAIQGVMSGVLETSIDSSRGGVGLAEFGFITTSVPEPSTFAILGLCGMLGVCARRRHPDC